jgi:hypothetical protein
MPYSDTRPNWLSEIIEEQRPHGDQPTSFTERQARRDAIVTAIQAHPRGQRLSGLPGLADAVWAALGVAHRTEHEARQNPDADAAAPAIQASLFLLELDPHGD